MTLQAWAEARFGKPADEITTADIEQQAPREDRPDPPFEGMLGGRVRYRLRPWPTKDEATELRERAKHFLDKTPS